MNNTRTGTRAKSPLALCIFISLGAGAIGALVSANSSKVISSIKVPAYQPPQWVFPVVWTVLFLLMGISSWLVAGSDKPYEQRQDAWKIYLWQLAFNILWSAVFFRLRLFYAALFCIVILWGFIIAMIISFSRCSRVAALLQVPYLLWVTFAAVLNRAIAMMN